jgi:TATA-box binding protein (TBP) (component of TFIID and TFIIIB)
MKKDLRANSLSVIKNMESEKIKVPFFTGSVNKVEKKVKKVGGDFDCIPVSTRTMVVVTNWALDIKTIFENLYIEDYIIAPKKRGRKSYQETLDPNRDLLPGSIIFASYAREFRGVRVKKQKKKDKKKKKDMRNSLSLYIKLEEKLVNLKLYNNGKFQLTGCSKALHAEQAVIYMHNIIRNISIVYPEVYNIITGPCGEIYPIAIFQQVMINVDYVLGFDVDREKFDGLMNGSEEPFFSIYEPVLGYSGVNTKIHSDNPHEEKLVMLKWVGGFVKKTRTMYANYLSLLSKKCLKKELNTEHYHTFLIFQSGSIIQSGPRKSEMKEVYEKFMKIINDNRSLVMENLES